MIGRIDATGRAGFSPQLAEQAFTFIARLRFATQTLAHMLDSLVRVSRRGKVTTISSSITFPQHPEGRQSVGNAPRSRTTTPR